MRRDERRKGPRYAGKERHCDMRTVWVWKLRSNCLHVPSDAFQDSSTVEKLVVGTSLTI